MLRAVDALLNRITMYRLVLYYLLFLVGYAIFFSIFGVLPYNAVDIVALTAILSGVSWGSNIFFARIFGAEENNESSFITGLILALIINPSPVLASSSLIFWVTAGFAASLSKYILAPFKKHIFNPAAFAVAATAILIGQPASWWVGSFPIMLPPVFFGGLLVARKLRKAESVLNFLTVSIIMLFWKGGWNAIPQTFFNAPLFFFAFIMLPEPSTAPPGKKLRSAYGLIVGVLSIFYTYELSLLIGNLFSYIVSPKSRIMLKLESKKEIAPGTYEFSFVPHRKVSYLPGQYFEWTLKHKKADLRGIRRYFTVVSSPTEETIKLATRFAGEKSSTFKKTLVALETGGKISVSQLEGDFTMPSDTKKKLAFIAGGIGITPFRSMIKYLIDKNEKRDIVLFYSNKSESDIVFKEIFEEARQKLGIRTIYINSDKEGFITDKTIIREAPDFKERVFYISGPHSMVDIFETILPKMGVPLLQIKTDFFPGYA